MDEKLDLNKNTEIAEALKEFEAKSSVLPEQKQTSENLKVDTNLDLKEKVGIAEALKEFEAKSGIIRQEKKAIRPEETDEDLSLKGKGKIEDSLKEFETKYIAEQQQKKAVEVKEEPKGSKMVSLIMKLSGGLVKEEKQAEYVLLGLTILFFLVSGYLFFSTGNTKKPQPLSPAELEYFKQLEAKRLNNN